MCRAAPLAPPTGSYLHRQAKLLTFLLMSAGVSATYRLCAGAQGARQDLGKRILGADFLMSQLGRGMKVGLFEAELIGV